MPKAASLCLTSALTLAGGALLHCQKVILMEQCPKLLCARQSLRGLGSARSREDCTLLSRDLVWRRVRGQEVVDGDVNAEGCRLRAVEEHGWARAVGAVVGYNGLARPWLLAISNFAFIKEFYKQCINK